MSLQFQSKIFGSTLRTRILVAVSLLEETFPTELTRLLQANLLSVQRVIDNLEIEGLVVSRKLGVERRVSLNPRYFAMKELKPLLTRLGEQDTALQGTLSQRRARPRRRGKEL